MKNKEINKASAENKNLGAQKKKMGLRFHAVLAQSLNGVIGKNGTLPWHEPEDLKSFVRITKGGWLLMGRHTWEGLNGCLPGRKSLVLSSNTSLDIPKDAFLASNWKQAMEMLPQNTTAFIIGGAQIYNDCFFWLDEIWVTLIKTVCSGDTHFDVFHNIHPLEWDMVEQNTLSTKAELFRFKRKI